LAVCLFLLNFAFGKATIHGNLWAFMGVYVQKQFRDAVYIDTNIHE
jgi:hypothetical protein